MARRKKEQTIRINTKDNEPKEVNVSKYYNVVCQKTVSQYYFLYRKPLNAYGLELADLKQEILLMIWQILVNNSKIQKITPKDMGGYLYNATKWRLNSMLSKAMTSYKHTVRDSTYHIDNMSNKEENKHVKSSEKILRLFCDQHDADLINILTKVCTRKEALATEEYYFNKLSTVEIGKKMELTAQRASALINSALLKLNFYFTQFITSRSEDE